MGLTQSDDSLMTD